jgi:hypothetical protein
MQLGLRPMQYPDRRLSAALVAVLLAVAIVGYLAGHARSVAASGEKMLTASATSVLLEYPSGWQPVAAAPVIPGLSLAHPVALAPHGDAARAGLLTGQFAAGGPSPLPGQFVARTRQPPETEVVSLPEIQAYRYLRFSVLGFDHELSLYVIPNPGGESTAVVCYASTASSPDMRTCQQIVATLTLIGQSQSYDLTPEPAYARRLGASIAALAAQRVALRREMGLRAPSATVQRLAGRLAAGFAHAAASLTALEPSLTIRQAQAVLSASLLRARDAYTTLAVAVSNGSPASFAAAQRQVSEAETGVDGALESFVLLGYNPT